MTARELNLMLEEQLQEDCRASFLQEGGISQEISVSETITTNTTYVRTSVYCKTTTSPTTYLR